MCQQFMCTAIYKEITYLSIVFLLALPSTYVNIYISTKQTYAHKNAGTNCIANRKTEMFHVCCFKYFS